jgi:hypothetical protein
VKRRCEDCGADISHRFVLAKMCVRCNGKRNRAASKHAAKARRQPSRQSVIVRPGQPGSLFPISDGYRAEIRIDGNTRERRFGTREDAEQWLAEVAQCRSL